MKENTSNLMKLRRPRKKKNHFCTIIRILHLILTESLFT